MFTARSLTPIDRELSKKVVKIIHGLLMMEESAAFRKPVPHKALGLEDYKLIVKKPTDLNLIRRQNNEGKYKFAEEILDEIQLCWDNCKLYNALGCEIYEQALFMEKAFDRLGAEILPDFWKDLNREEENQRFRERKIEEEKLKKNDNKGGSSKKEKMIPQPVSEEYQRNNSKAKKGGSPSQYDMDEEVEQPKPEQVHEIEREEPVGQEPEKESMQAEADEPECAVQPLMVNLNDTPTRDQLLQLSNIVKDLYAAQELGTLEKVLEILHNNEKQNMTLNKNGVMSFRMSNIHISTYYRLRKLLTPHEEVPSLIE